MKRIMIANGKYTAKDGQEKTSWKEVGVIMTSQTGKEFCLLDPAVCLSGFPREQGKDRVIASIFEDKPQDRPSQQTSQYQQQPTPIGQTNNGAPIVVESQEIPF